MKKIITLLLALSMVFCFAACGNTDTDDSGSAEGLPSPVTEFDSLQALADEFGCALIAPTAADAENQQFFTIEGEPKIAQYNFKVNGYDCTLRFAAVGMDTDISGYYKEDGTTVFQTSEAETSSYENDEAKLMRWFTIDGQYVFCMIDNGEVEYNAFDAIVQELQSVKPVNWNSDGAFEDYKALEGYYQDETSQRAMASFSISGDHGKLYIMWGNSADETCEWIIDVVLDENGNLVYDKEVRNIYKTDENGSSTQESLEDGGAGTIEVKDGKLYFTNAADEALRECVFAPYTF